MNDLFVRGMRLPDTRPESYPYTIPAVQNLDKLAITDQVTFLVGENGTGKSTIIEAISIACGFSPEGGTKNYSYSTKDTSSSLGNEMTLIRGVKHEKYGYFLRAESFYTTANYAEGARLDQQVQFQFYLTVSTYTNSHMVKHFYPLLKVSGRAYSFSMNPSRHFRLRDCCILCLQSMS